MTHLTMEQLLATREPGLEPGVQAHRDHLEACPACRAERDRIDQRIARLKALPTLRPGRDGFGAIRLQAARERRGLRLRRVALAGLALAAAVTLAVAWNARRSAQRLERTLVNPELAEMMSRSQELERALAGFDQDRAVVSGRAVGITTSLEDRLARVDRQIEAVDFLAGSARQQQMVRLWRERVGLLDALVDVHLTDARYVGF
jgi:hypothetical protein